MRLETVNQVIDAQPQATYAHAAAQSENPMTPIIESFRFAFLGSGAVNVNGLLYSAGFMLVVLFIGLLLFNQVERSFMDTV